MKLQNLSIKRKLMLITMLTSSVALLLSSASFLIYDLISFRHLLTQDLETQAQIIGYNSAAAMAFRDQSVASATLAAQKPKRTSSLRFSIHLKVRSSRNTYLEIS